MHAAQASRAPLLRRRSGRWWTSCQDTAARFRTLQPSTTAAVAELRPADGRGPGQRPAAAPAGLGAGDKIGVRIPSGTNELYISILAVLLIGAAYVPVDADDPDERAKLVFGEARVAGILRANGEIVTDQQAPRPFPEPADPATPDDDAWVIFTSGSTGTPKGVAVPHRSAAAFVDAEARIFLQDEPVGPQDRVLAGLSVAFDASCEEMWLAWRHGACLVPAPRALVRTGMDLGPWLISHGITVVSTVPTLAALWPAEALENVRLLIFGGEACPPELAERLAVDGREVWNTYGPTEATVVACAAPLGGTGPVRIGLPLDGWDLAVVDADGVPVAEGEVGELIIGGVGLARYLDPAKDAEKYAPMPSLGWDAPTAPATWSATKTRGPDLHGPRRRTGQARRPPDRTRRDRRRPAVPAGRRRRRRRGSHDGGRQPGPRGLPGSPADRPSTSTSPRPVNCCRARCPRR